MSGCRAFVLWLFIVAPSLGAASNVDDDVQQVRRTYDKYRFTVFFSALHATKDNSTVAFAHGFGLTAEKYEWLAQSLALAGHIVVLPHSSGAPDSKLLALAAAAGAAGVLNESNTDSSSPFFRACWHSLGIMWSQSRWRDQFSGSWSKHSFWTIPCTK